MIKGTGHYKFCKDCYISKTPIWIITKSNDWIGGYLNSEPNSLFCEVLDWKKNEVRKVVYSSIHIIKEFRGDFNKLILPSYLKEEI